jgi:hypothetical protein
MSIRSRPVLRYEHKHTGDLIHCEIQRLARIGIVIRGQSQNGPGGHPR